MTPGSTRHPSTPPPATAKFTLVVGNKNHLALAHFPPPTTNQPIHPPTHTHPYTHTPNNVDLYTIVDQEGTLSEIPGGRLRPRRSVQGRASGLHHRWQQRNIHARSLAHDCEPPSDTQAIELLGSWSIIPQSWYWSAQARSHDATPFREIDVERQACSGQPGSPSHY
jgi:hypothetical protein